MRRFLEISGVLVLLLTAAFAAPAGRSAYADQGTAAPTVVATASQGGTLADVTVTDADFKQARTVIGDGIVGLISCTQNNEYFKNLLSKVTGIMDAAGIKTVLFDSQADENKELQGLNDLVNNKNAKALVVCALYNKAFEKALQDASAKGIKIVMIEASHEVNVPDAVKFVDQNVELGDLAGRYAGQYINDHMGGQASVVILDYPDQPSIVERANAIARGLCGVAPGACHKDANGKSIPIPRFKGGTSDFGEQAGKDILTKYPDTNLLVSINDAGAQGAIKAFQAAGKTPKDIAVVGIDGLPGTIDDMKNPQGGWFRGTVAIDIDGVAQLTANSVIRLLLGAQFPHRLDQPLKMITRDALLAATPGATPSATQAAS